MSSFTSIHWPAITGSEALQSLDGVKYSVEVQKNIELIIILNKLICIVETVNLQNLYNGHLIIAYT